LTLSSARVRWASDAERLTAHAEGVRLYGGKAIGDVVVPFRAEMAGSVKLRFDGIDVAPLAKEFEIPVTLEGRTSGRLDGTLSPAGPDHERSLTGKLTLDAFSLRVQGITGNNVQGTIDYQNNKVTYHFEGEALDGRLFLEGSVPVGDAAAKPGAGRLRIEQT